MRLCAFLVIYYVLTSIKSFKKKWSKYKQLLYKRSVSADGSSTFPQPRLAQAGWGQRPPRTTKDRICHRKVGAEVWIYHVQQLWLGRAQGAQMNASRTPPAFHLTLTLCSSATVGLFSPDRQTGLQELSCGSQIISGEIWIEKSQLRPSHMFLLAGDAASLPYSLCVQFANYFSMKYLRGLSR